MPRPAPAKRYLNADEAAEYLCIPSRKALYAQVERGRIPHRRLGRRIVFDRLDLDRWIARQPGVSVADALREAS